MAVIRLEHVIQEMSFSTIEAAVLLAMSFARRVSDSAQDTLESCSIEAIPSASKVPCYDDQVQFVQRNDLVDCAANSPASALGARSARDVAQDGAGETAIDADVLASDVG